MAAFGKKSRRRANADFKHTIQAGNNSHLGSESSRIPRKSAGKVLIFADNTYAFMYVERAWQYIYIVSMAQRRKKKDQ